MTDEELAEEYVKSVIDVNAFDWKIVREIALAYLAGLGTKVKSLSTETLLKELKDRGVIRSWYYNGTYHVGNEL